MACQVDNSILSEFRPRASPPCDELITVDRVGSRQQIHGKDDLSRTAACSAVPRALGWRSLTSAAARLSRLHRDDHLGTGRPSCREWARKIVDSRAAAGCWPVHRRLAHRTYIIDTAACSCAAAALLLRLSDQSARLHERDRSACRPFQLHECQQPSHLRGHTHAYPQQSV